MWYNRIMKKWFCIVLIAALLLPCLGCADSGGGASVTFFKAGKADAAVVQTENAVILVDTGLAKNSDDLIGELTERGVESIDVLIVSHFDKDHVGGAADVIAAFPVGTVYQSNYPKDSEEYAAYTAALAAAGIEPVTVSDTVSFTLDGLSVVIDGPDQALYAVDPSNNSSLIATVACGDTTVLFAGDAQDARITEYLATFERPAGTLILKVPYHGHWQSALPDFLAAVSPDIAVIPCSKSEPDEDEIDAVTALLDDLGAEIHLTRDGDYTVSLS